MALLAFSEKIAVWHIYFWALITGLVWMTVRPAYKVIITQAVPQEEVRPAVSLNSITETSAIVLMNVGGSALLGWLGLPLAFLFNSLSYITAVFCLTRLRELSRAVIRRANGWQMRQLWVDLKEGLIYLSKTKGLLYPLLLTFVGIAFTAPASSLLPAIVNNQGGSLLQLGLLGGSASLGALLGAVFAGMRSERNPLRTYPIWGLLASLSVCLFVINPISIIGGVGLSGLGFLAFSQAVWNTSRVSDLAESAYQARLQSITSMTFTLGAPIGAIWGGTAVDHFGLSSLLVGAGLLMLISLGVLIKYR
jgi:predicted MFS family arabinose efflux permease